jgi:hypothetical protein
MKPLFSLLALLFLVSCKSTSLSPLDTGTDLTWKGGEPYEVLVALRSYNPELRMLFEQEMTAALRKEGINAVSSYTLIQDADLLNLSNFSKLLKPRPMLTIYFVQATTVSKKETNSDPSESPIFAELLNSEDWKTTFIARMESAIYVSGQDNAVWWNVTQVKTTEQDVDEMATRFVESEMKYLKKSDMIRRLKK